MHSACTIRVAWKRDLACRRGNLAWHTQGLSRSIYVTASLMMAQLTHKPETLEGYLLTLGWLFASFVLAASYTAELASFLTAGKEEVTVSEDGVRRFSRAQRAPKPAGVCGCRGEIPSLVYGVPIWPAVNSIRASPSCCLF